jgi:hypothetical protein
LDHAFEVALQGGEVGVLQALELVLWADDVSLISAGGVLT